MGESTAEGFIVEDGSTRRPAIRNAGRVVVAAGALGLLGQLLFFDVGLGVNVPIAVGLLLAGGWMLRRRDARPDLRDAWLAPAALAFAVFTALRADPAIATLDVLAALALTGAALASFGGVAVTSRPVGGLVRLSVRLLGWAAAGAVPALSDARHQLPSGAAAARHAAPALPVVRGLLLALPIVLIFIALFSSADAVFARVVGDLFDLELNLDEALGRMVLAGALAWLAAGGLALAGSTLGAPREAAAPTRWGWRAGTTEVVTVLLAVNAVFAVFVALQGAYLFGGLDTLQAAGLSYAEYARRGFFELVTVAILAGGLIVAGERVARDRSRTLLTAGMGLALLTGVVLVSATLRLRLYQEAYGWTELRLYVLASIVVLGIGLVGLLVALATDRVRWIVHLLVGAALAAGLVLNAVGPVRFITEQNVARVLDPTLVPEHGQSGIDAAYAVSLGDDAIPDLVRVLPMLEVKEAAFLRHRLYERLVELRHQPGLGTWQAWNAGREAARSALEAADRRGDLDQATGEPSW